MEASSVQETSASSPSSVRERRETHPAAGARTPGLPVEGEVGGGGPLGEVVPPELQDKEAARDTALSVRERDRRKDVEILLHTNGEEVTPDTA